MTVVDARRRARPRGVRPEGLVSSSGHKLDASIDTALLSFIQQIQQHAKGDFVEGMSDGGALRTDGTKALKQKAEDGSTGERGADRSRSIT